MLHSAQIGVAPKLSLYSGYYLQRIKRLCDIVIGTGGKPKDFVVILAFCGKKNYGQVINLAQLCRCRNAVHLGHHNIHKHKMNFVVLRYGYCFPAVFRLQYAVALSGKVDFEGGTNVFVVVTDKNSVHIFASVTEFISKTFKIKVYKILSFI